MQIWQQWVGEMLPLDVVGESELGSSQFRYFYRRTDSTCWGRPTWVDCWKKLSFQNQSGLD